MRIHAKRHDRTEKPVVSRLWIKPQTSDFHDCFSFLLQLDRLQLTGGVKTTPQKTRFRSVNLHKEFAYRSEIE